MQTEIIRPEETSFLLVKTKKIQGIVVAMQDADNIGHIKRDNVFKAKMLHLEFLMKYSDA